LVRDGESLVLLFCGGTKKRQQSDIQVAQQLRAEYYARKKVTTRRSPTDRRGRR
jgi:putative component of toxin-antitoxin plasmid stabilization module